MFDSLQLHLRLYKCLCRVFAQFAQDETFVPNYLPISALQSLLESKVTLTVRKMQQLLEDPLAFKKMVDIVEGPLTGIGAEWPQLSATTQLERVTARHYLMLCAVFLHGYVTAAFGYHVYAIFQEYNRANPDLSSRFAFDFPPESSTFPNLPPISSSSNQTNIDTLQAILSTASSTFGARRFESRSGQSGIDTLVFGSNGTWAVGYVSHMDVLRCTPLCGKTKGYFMLLL